MCAGCAGFSCVGRCKLSSGRFGWERQFSSGYGDNLLLLWAEAGVEERALLVEQAYIGCVEAPYGIYITFTELMFY